MYDYDDLIKNLRYCADTTTCKYCFWRSERCLTDMKRNAANAIEELQAQLMYSNDAAKAIAEKMPQWVRAEEQLPPPAEIQEYLVRVRSGGPDYGGYDYDYDFATWGAVYWCKDGSVTYEWTNIMNGLVGAVEITHWMPLPEPPMEEV